MTTKDGSIPSKGSTAAWERHAELHREERRFAELRREEPARRARHDERRLAELRREEAARLALSLGGLPLAQDQSKISLLRTVHARLQEVDHDYEGHRVEAMNSLGQALGHLGSSAPPGVGAGLSLGNLPRTQSDGILRDAIVQLRIVEGQLDGSAGQCSAPRPGPASISQAIHHLAVALRTL